MAMNSVSIVQPRDKVVTKKGREGGGSMGQTLGTIAGAVAGSAGGPMGAMQGAAMGGQLGGMAGEKVKPSQAGSEAIQRRMAAQGPQLQQNDHTATLKESILALQEQPEHIRAEYSPPLVNAYAASVAKQHPKRMA